MKKWIIVGVVLLVAINIVTLGTIGYRFLRCPRRQGICHSLKPHLSLSESQLKQLKPLEKSLELKMEKLRILLREKRGELVDLLTEPQPDQKAIANKLNEIASGQVELEKEIVTHLLQIKEILTPMQQKKFFALIEDRLCPGGKHRPCKCKHGHKNCMNKSLKERR